VRPRLVDHRGVVTVFHPGVNHGHGSSGRWSDVQANPNSSFVLNHLCPRMTPRELVGVAIAKEFRDKPIALDHLNWYLVNGRGADFPEDDNIKEMLEQDASVQAAIRTYIPPGRTSGTFASHLKLEQQDCAIQDFRYAFGAIDCLDFEVDFDAGALHVWFQDRYEWHLVYAGLYTMFADDAPRETNCLHAALVELKSTGAADFWMKGEATVPLSAIATGRTMGRSTDTK
jgi:hypothetical protein